MTTGKEITILCVDDEANVLKSIKRLLLDENYTILTAGSGEEGLEVLKRVRIQLIIADYRMPGMNGIEFLREVRRYWPDTIRIVLSGYADTASILAAINEGQIYKFIPKPWNDDELKVAILNALESYFLAKKNIELTKELQKQYKELQKLLHEKNDNLELRTGMLRSHQNILDSIPVGILGVDLNNIVIQCNAKWFEISGVSPVIISEKAERVLPREIVQCIEAVKLEGNITVKRRINGVMCYILGGQMTVRNQRGILLSFIMENDLLKVKQ
jgi:two-component system, NtrC family, sensor kinase